MDRPHTIAAHLSAVFIVSLLVAGVFSMTGVDAHHNAIMFKPALDVAHGKILFRDTFTQYGALTTFIQAASIKILGEYLLSIRFATVLIIGTSYLFFWLSWSQIMKPSIATFAWLSSLLTANYFRDVFLPWSSEYALCFQAIGGYLFLRYVRENSRVALFGAGASAGLAFWCRQNVGPPMALGLAAALVFLAWNRSREIGGQRWWCTALNSILWLSAGFSAACAPVFVWLVCNGALRDWFKQSIEFAYYFGKTVGLGGSTPKIILLRLIFAPLPWNILPIFCMAILIICSRKISKGVRLTFTQEAVCSLSFLALASLTQYFPVPDIAHLYWAGVPAIGMLFYGLIHLFRRRLILVVVYVAIFGKVFADGWTFSSRLLRESSYTSSSLGVLSGMRLNQQEFKQFQFAKSTLDLYMKAYPEMRLINDTPEAMYLLFVPDYSFHPLYVSWESLETTVYPEYRQKLDAQVALQKHMLLSWNPVPVGYSRVCAFDSLRYNPPLVFYVPTRKLLHSAGLP